MKLLLHVFVLLLTVSALQAQKVVIKDSGSYSYYNGFYQPRGSSGDVATHTVNRFCKDSIIQSQGLRILYSYNALQQVTEVLNQSRYYPGDTFASTLRTRYAYTPAGKYDTLTLASAGAVNGVLFNRSQFRYIYNGTNYLLKQLQYSWDASFNSWTYRGEQTYFNNSSGTPDSAYGYAGYDTAIAVYSYYTNGKLYQVKNYTLHNGSRALNSTTTSYHDSSGYMRRDSSVTQQYFKNSDSLYITGIYSYTHFFNTDGTEKQTSIYSYSTDGVTSSTNYNGIYYFYGNCFSALPVSFLSFYAQKQNNNAILHWQSADDINTTSFQVQRSTDGVQFTTAGTVKGSNNGSHSYSFIDTNALLIGTPALYYRLAEKDSRGTDTYSKIVTLDIPAGKASIKVSPNPVSNRITIYMSAAMGAAQIVVTDMRGKVMYSAKQNAIAGSEISINTAGFAKGLYIVTIQSNTNKQQVKVIKE